jgi:ribonuclease P protein component
LIEGRTQPQRLTLPAQRRLRRKSDFEAAYARGRRMGNGFFGVTARLNDLDRPRLGLAVASKTAGSSVERNRIRRIVRESFRLHQHELPAADIVVSARPRARGAASRELRAGIEELWLKVQDQCGSSPRS